MVMKHISRKALEDGKKLTQFAVLNIYHNDINNWSTQLMLY